MAKTSRPATDVIEVDMVSDFVCPWCWLGYKLYKQGAKGTKTRLTFRPYLLDPTVPDEGAEYKAYMQSKFGDEPSNKFKAMREHLERAGPAAGANFDFNAITRRPNTLNAHRLMRWAQGQDTGEACADALFKAYFEKGEDIGDTDILCRIAEEIGLDAELTRELLAGPNDKLETQQEIMFFKGLGISGVPTFIYQGQLAVQGAQDGAAHKQAIAQATKLDPINN